MGTGQHIVLGLRAIRIPVGPTFDTVPGLWVSDGWRAGAAEGCAAGATTWKSTG
jgi:hypothetical protein